MIDRQTDGDEKVKVTVRQNESKRDGICLLTSREIIFFHVHILSILYDLVDGA